MLVRGTTFHLRVELNSHGTTFHLGVELKRAPDIVLRTKLESEQYREDEKGGESIYKTVRSSALIVLTTSTSSPIKDNVLLIALITSLSSQKKTRSRQRTMKLFGHILILFISTALACDSWCKCKGTVRACIAAPGDGTCDEACKTRGGAESCSWFNKYKFYGDCH
jgi:hypothetical protein